MNIIGFFFFFSIFFFINFFFFFRGLCKLCSLRRSLPRNYSELDSLPRWRVVIKFHTYNIHPVVGTWKWFSLWIFLLFKSLNWFSRQKLQGRLNSRKYFYRKFTISFQYRCNGTSEKCIQKPINQWVSLPKKSIRIKKSNRFHVTSAI